MKTLPKIIAIGGPTASGKTSLSLKLAQEFRGEIVNADSRQVYRYMDIGTGKEPVEKKNPDGSVIIGGIVHYLIDILEPNEPYSLAQFQCDAFRTIDSILKKNKLPILVGGTGLYVDSVVYGYDLTHHTPDTSVREKLRNSTVQELQHSLRELSPHVYTSLNESDRNNPRRLIRGIERAMSESANSDTPPKNYRNIRRYTTLYFSIQTPEEKLETHISKRVTSMFHNGLVEENLSLRNSGFTTKHTSMSSIGYQELDPYFPREQTLEEVQAAIELHTRQYAKRQMTWFKRNKDISWVRGYDDARPLVQNFLSEEP